MRVEALHALNQAIAILSRLVDEPGLRIGERAALRGALGAIRGIRRSWEATPPPDYRERQLPVGDR